MQQSVEIFGFDVQDAQNAMEAEEATPEQQGDGCVAMKVGNLRL
jgi:hypothetical protein